MATIQAEPPASHNPRGPRLRPLPRWETVPEEDAPSYEPVGEPAGPDAFQAAPQEPPAIPHRPLSPALQLAALAGAAASCAACLGLQYKVASISARLFSPHGDGLVVLLALAWASLQTLALIAVYRATPSGFTVCLSLVTALGLGIVNLGRYGLTETACSLAGWSMLGWLPVVPAVRVFGAGSSFPPLPQERAVRLFCWLSLVGAVYIESAQSSDGINHLAAFAVAMAILGVMSAGRSLLNRVLRRMEAWPPVRLATTLWLVSVTILLANALTMSITGSRTPQIDIGPLSLAPYYIVSFSVLLAVALEFQMPDRSFRRLLIGLAAITICYLWGLHEGGTLAVVALGLVTLAIILAPWSPLVVILALASGGYLLVRTRLFISMAHSRFPRIADRLAAWQGLSRTPEQLQRVWEIAKLSGWIGRAGAARVQFLIGREAVNDYMPTVILAQGGRIGLLLAAASIFLLVLELARCASRQVSPLRKALVLTVVVSFASNALLVLLPLSNATPLVGLPFPMLARAGSHFVIAGLAIGMVVALARCKEETCV